MKKILNILAAGGFSLLCATSLAQPLPVKVGSKPASGKDAYLVPECRLLRPDYKASPLHGQMKGKLCKQFPRRSGTLKGADFLVNLVYKTDWTAENMTRGMYIINTSSPQNLEPLAFNNDLIITSGSGIVGDEFYGLYANLQYKDYGLIESQLYCYNTDTWELKSQSKLDAKQMTIVSVLETAENAATGDVYGEFYDKELENYEWGIVDYPSKARSTIASATHNYVALGCTNDDVLYGVDDEANLYRIDTGTGEETLIGNTGLQVKDENGAHYGQTGEIDPNTNTFYWLARDAEGEGALFTVNLETAELTKLADLGQTQYSALTIPLAATSAQSPEKATGLSASFSDASTTGTVSFTVPTKALDGSDLSGQLSYSVKVGSKTLATGKTTPGATVSTQVTADEGMNIFAVSTTADGHESPKAHVAQWVGYDVPLASEKVNFTYDFDTKTSSLSWQPVVAGCHDRYVGNITYDLYRVMDGDQTLIKKGLTETSFTEKLDIDGLHQCQYGVVARNEKRSGSMTLSSPVDVGEPLETPYTEDFTKENNNIGLWSLIDNNGDGVTWGWTRSTNGCYAYMYGSGTKDDDWLISPPFNLKAGRTYTVSVDLGNDGEKANKVELKGARKVSLESLTLPVADETTIMGKTTLDGKLTADADGRYYISIHNVSEATSGMLYLYKMTVKCDPLATAPDSATALGVEPDANGLRTAKVSFTTPSKAINGNGISNLSKVELLRGDSVVNTWNQPAVNTQLSFDDTKGVPNGFNTYSVIAYNEDGYGRTASKTVYIGEDTAKAVKNLTAQDLGQKVRLAWDATENTGINGRVVRTADARYIIYNVDANNKLSNAIDTVRTTTADIDFNTNEGEQRTARWAVVVLTGAGKSSAAKASLPVGSPYTLPFTESFANGKFGKFWTASYSSYSIQPKLYDDNSSDDDGGCYGFYNYTKGEGSLQSGKISLAGSASPMLTYDFYPVQGKDVLLKVEVVKSDGTVDTVRTWNYKELPGTSAWASDKLDLSKYVNESYVRLRFHVVYNESRVKTLIDNINLFDQLDDNLALSLIAPQRVVRGQKMTVGATVKNMGKNSASNYTVNFYEGDKLVKDTVVATSLSSMKSETVTTELPTNSSLKEYTSLNVRAEVVYDEDLSDDDNTAEATVAVTQADVAPVSNLEADVEGDNTSLNWAAPAATIKTVTENFESYDAFATNFGNWTTIDDSKGYMGSMFSNYTEPYKRQPGAFLIFNPDAVNEDVLYWNPDMAPHSGSQYCAALYKMSDKTGYDHVNNNEWLISPRLSGNAQTITMWVKNEKDQYDNDYEEDFDFLTSTTGVEEKDFTKVGDTYQITGGTWQQISVEVPEGTLYFAIHHNTIQELSFMLSIDDVTFEAGSSQPVGYNVYRDGELVAFVSEATFFSEALHDNVVYSVTAVYPDGAESEPVEATVATALTETRLFANGPKDVYDLSGKLVRKGSTNLRGLQKGVYVVGGRKVILR